MTSKIHGYRSWHSWSWKTHSYRSWHWFQNSRIFVLEKPQFLVLKNPRIKVLSLFPKSPNIGLKNSRLLVFTNPLLWVFKLFSKYLNIGPEKSCHHFQNPPILILKIHDFWPWKMHGYKFWHSFKNPWILVSNNPTLFVFKNSRL